MKRKLCLGILIASLVAPTLSYAFGEDIVYLIQMIRNGDLIYQQATQAAAFVRSPGAWKQMISNATVSASTILGKPSAGYDIIALQQIAEGRQSAIEAMRQIVNSPGFQPTASNTAQVSLLHLQAVEATRQMNELQATLNYQQQVKQYQAADPGMSAAVEEMNAWHLKQ
jgi:hypothetical protein